jgi:hypothetical protein
MVAEVFAGLSAFKTMFDMTKALSDIHDVTTRDRAIVELQKEILAAQAQQSALMTHVGELEKEVARLKAWDADKQRYKLTDVGNGMTTYTLKEGMESGEPPHNLCASCYHDHQKEIMQPETRFPGRCEVLVCHRCGSDLYLSGGRQPEHHAMKRTPRR